MVAIIEAQEPGHHHCIAVIMSHCIIIIITLCSLAMSRLLNAHIQTPKGRAALFSGHVDEDGRPHGYGKRVVTSKDVYEGHVYTGMWVHGGFEGVGKIVTPEGYERVGEFVDGGLEGNGVFKWPNGKKYSGQFKDGQRHGYGTHTWSDGRMLIGRWDNEKKHGIALSVHANGSKEAHTYYKGALVEWQLGMLEHDRRIHSKAF
jgi:hypothetical protein